MRLSNNLTFDMGNLVRDGC